MACCCGKSYGNLANLSTKSVTNTMPMLVVLLLGVILFYQSTSHQPHMQLYIWPGFKYEQRISMESSVSNGNAK